MMAMIYQSDNNNGASCKHNIDVFFFQKYYHGESIAVNVLVDNNTSKTVKKVKLSGKCMP